jgi:uncharacterized protein involved in exopolysaccharide biosynthesis
MTMSEATKKRAGPDVFMSVWRRRKWLALSTFAVILCAAASVAAFLPDLYRGTATVIVERPDVTESLVRPGEADELETRLQTIEEKLLSRARLGDLIQRFNLYSGQRTQGASTEAIIERMRRDIRLEPRGVDPTVGHGATVSFDLSYWGDNARTAAEVANTLAASYVADNLKSREHQAASSANFLKAQLDEAKAHLDESSEAQARLVGHRDGLVKRLASMEPAGGPRAAGVARLTKLREELTELRTRYKESHPMITRAQSEIRAVESQVAGLAPRDNTGPADGGAVQRIREDLAQADAALMSSSYATDKDRYLSLVKLYEEARLNESMEQEQQGVQFAILDPAVEPDGPASPNRFRILLGGLAISIGLALGAVLLAERADTSFHALDDLKEFTRVPVLASIPRIVTKKGKRQRRYRVFLGTCLALLGLPLVVGASYLVTRWAGSLLLMIIGGRT